MLKSTVLNFPNYIYALFYNDMPLPVTNERKSASHDFPVAAQTTFLNVFSFNKCENMR